MGAQQVGRDAATVGQPVQCVLQLGLLTGAIDLGPVAGGDQGGFRLAGQRAAQATQGGLNLVNGERKPTAQIERCGRVIDA